MIPTKLIKYLKIKFKSTLPKIPIEEIYFNPIKVLPRNLTEIPDNLIENNKFENLPNTLVPIDLIVPTQTYITITNLLKIKNITIYTDAYLVKYKNYYYVLDGHHRIGLNILNSSKSIFAHVYKV